MFASLPLSSRAVLTCIAAAAALGAHSVDVASAQPCEPALLSIVFDEQGFPVVEVLGSPDGIYRLEGATSLAGGWDPLLDFTGETAYADPSIVDLPARFYRAVCVESVLLSQNAVGYIKMTDPPKKRKMTGACFDGPNGTVPTVSQLIGGVQDGQIPNGTTVHVWNGEQYESATRGAQGWINDPLVVRGQGFWVEVADAPGDDGVLYMIGEVPSAPVTSLVDLHEDMIANPYPTDWAWDASGLAQSLPQGSSLTLWDGSDFVTSNKGRFGWSPSLSIPMGESGFMLSGPGEPLPWDHPKPYAWP